ncbi:O-acetylhomoserine (thiol)-lyase [Penicillium subrubescens]|uniref:O-acetylhomoserine (Thiol)-lyase n=1 Tax=Penicillium subrubescens TaxID=1316194 RepID=A0A1Q5SUL5_9EURO|nr:O-acetylhomoserine (thiol)-lyase [Penicillium subrubescens]
MASMQRESAQIKKADMPTVEVFERRAAALEGGTAAVATASGQSAVFQTILALAGSGDNIISSVNLYGGSYSLFKTLLPRLGIEKPLEILGAVYRISEESQMSHIYKVFRLLLTTHSGLAVHFVGPLTMEQILWFTQLRNGSEGMEQL